MARDKRPVGRPRGSGKNDTPHLAKVADLLAKDARLKPTTAMKRVIAERSDWGTVDETLLRRWQGKWKVEGAQLLREARARKAQSERPTESRTYGPLAPGVIGAGLSLRNMPPAVKKMLEQPFVARSGMSLRVGAPAVLAGGTLPSHFPRLTFELPDPMRKAMEIAKAIDASSPVRKVLQRIRGMEVSPAMREAMRILNATEVKRWQNSDMSRLLPPLLSPFRTR